MREDALSIAADAMSDDAMAERLVRALESSDDAALNDLLRDNPRAQDALILLTLQAESVRQLAGAVAANSERGTRNAERPAVVRLSLRVRRAAYAMAAAVLIGAAAVAIYLSVAGPDESTRAPMRAVVATVTDVEGVQWQTEPRYAGDDVSSGPIRTASGQMELELRSGATLRIVGACDLSLDSSMRVELTRGFVRFDCPAGAEGFTVLVPGGARVVDLGTRFAVAIDDAGRVRVYVEQGRVELHGVNGAVESLAVGGRGLIVGGRIEREAEVADARLSPIGAAISPMSPKQTFAAASDDLLQTAAAAMELGGAAAPVGRFGDQSVESLTNGPTVWYPRPRQTHESWSTDDGGSVAWMLDTDAAPFGYDIDRIDVLAGCWPNRIGHVYRIDVMTAGGGAWATLTDVDLPDNETNGSGEYERRVSVARRDGEPLAVGVTAIRFTFRDDNPHGGNLGQSVYREIDVIGRPTGVIRPHRPDESVDTASEIEPR